MGFTSHLIRNVLLNKRSLIVGGVLLVGLIYIACSWKFSRSKLTSSVATFLGTSLPRSAIAVSQCNCTPSCLSHPTALLTPISDKRTTKILNEADIKTQKVHSDHDNVLVHDQVGEDNAKYCVGRNQRFPQVIIIGVRKGGTRALINMLKIHPEISAAKTEIHYFDREENFFEGVQWYIERMPLTTKNQITIEKSPSYFVVNEVPLRMYMLSPQLKLLLIVRNPIERLVSDFLQLDSKRFKKNGNRYTFEELVFHSSGEVNEHYSPVSVSMYDIHFQRWLKHFNLKQIHIVDGDALIENPITELQKTETFLGVTPYFREGMFYFNESKGFYCWKNSGKSTCLGDGKGREHPSLSNSVHSRLYEFFSPHNENFFKLCQCQFNW